MKVRGQTGSSACPMAFMDDLYEVLKEADKIVTF